MSESRPLLEGDGATSSREPERPPAHRPELRGRGGTAFKTTKAGFWASFTSSAVLPIARRSRDAGAAWDQHHVGRSRCGHCGRFRSAARCRSRPAQPPPSVAACKALAESGVRKRDDNRGLTLSAIAPIQRRLPGVGSIIAAEALPSLGRRGDIGAGWFCRAFLADNGDCFHIAGSGKRIDGRIFA